MLDLDPFIRAKEEYPIPLPLKNADVRYYPNFLSEAQATDYFQTLLKTTPWREDSITLFGKTYPQPRLTALYGEEAKPYTYSGITMNPLPFEHIHLEIKKRIQDVCPENFTTVLLNLYRNGQDSNGWHSDDEKELGANPIIASISLGARRVFQLKHSARKDERYKFSLQHGSLLIMQGETQHYWKHQIPKTKKQCSPRINMTYRIII